MATELMKVEQNGSSSDRDTLYMLGQSGPWWSSARD